MDVVKEMFEGCCELGNGELASRDEWDAFTARLVAAEIVDRQDVGELDSVWTRARPFGAQGAGVRYEDLVQFLVDKFARDVKSPEVADTDAVLDRVIGQIRNLKELCREWAPDGKQVRQLADLVVLLHGDVRKANERVQDMVQRQRRAFLTGARATESGGASAFDRSPFGFHASNVRDLEQACAAARVRGALTHVDAKGHRRSSACKLTDKLGHTKSCTLDVSLGLASNGALVEAVDLASPGGLDADVAFACNCHAAHRELALSDRFPRWMGYSRNGQLYYEHFQDAVCVDALVAKFGVLVEPQPLLRLVLAQSLQALADLNEQSTFEVLEPLTLRNLFLVEGGTRLILGRVAWGEKAVCPTAEQADWAIDWARTRQILLLRSFRGVIQSLLGLRSLGATMPGEDRGPEQGSQASAKTETDGDGNARFVFNRVECDAGFRLPQGARFRLDLPSSAPGKVWRCVRLVDAVDEANAALSPLSGRRSQRVSIDAPSELAFTAQRPGLVRLFLKEVEWWEADDVAAAMGGKAAAAPLGPGLAAAMDPSACAELGGASLLCKVSIVDKVEQGRINRSSCSPALRAVLSACSDTFATMSPVSLRDLQSKYEVLALDGVSRDEAREDFAIYVGRP